MIADIPQEEDGPQEPEELMQKETEKSKRKRIYKKMMIKVKCDVKRMPERLRISRTTIILIHSFYYVWSTRFLSLGYSWIPALMVQLCPTDCLTKGLEVIYDVQKREGQIVSTANRFSSFNNLSPALNNSMICSPVGLFLSLNYELCMPCHLLVYDQHLDVQARFLERYFQSVRRAMRANSSLAGNISEYAK